MMVIIDMTFWAFIDVSPSHIIIMILFCTIRMYEGKSLCILCLSILQLVYFCKSYIFFNSCGERRKKIFPPKKIFFLRENTKAGWILRIWYIEEERITISGRKSKKKLSAKKVLTKGRWSDIIGKLSRKRRRMNLEK